MNITKKSLLNGLMLGVALATVAHLRADQITWTEDSSTALDVTITGTVSSFGADSYLFGIAFTEPPIVSPSGLWQIDTPGDQIFYTPDSPAPFDAQGGQAVAYLGTPTLPILIPGGSPPILGAQAYQMPQLTSIPAIGSVFDFGSLYLPGGWGGSTSLTVDFDPTDVAASTWTSTTEASGPNLSVDIPDNGSTVALFGVSLVVLFVLRRQLGF